MNESMRGLFFIMKGGYKNGVEPSFFNRASERTNHIGGYNPEDPNTEEWYMVIDCKSFHCLGASSYFDKATNSIMEAVKRYKGDGDLYLRTVNSIRRVTPSMLEIYKKVYETYGDYYRSEIEEVEDLAYKELKENTPFRKSRKLIKTKPKNKLVMETPKEEKVMDTTPKRLVKPKVKIGVKKLGMSS